MLEITRHLAIRAEDLTETFITANGPGGQNVNKVASAVQLRFDLAASGLPEGVRVRLERLAGRRLGKDGTIIITAGRLRTQAANRADARERLFALIRAAAVAPAPRKPTRPGKAARTRRLEDKGHRARIKLLRRDP